MGHWLLHVLGIDTQQSEFYDFWSGVGPCIIALVTLGSGVLAFVRSRNCHVKGCWRLGRHPVPGTQHVVCRRHSPHRQPTHEDVIRDYRAARARQDTEPL